MSLSNHPFLLLRDRPVQIYKGQGLDAAPIPRDRPRDWLHLCPSQKCPCTRRHYRFQFCTCVRSTKSVSTVHDCRRADGGKREGCPRTLDRCKGRLRCIREERMETGRGTLERPSSKRDGKRERGKDESWGDKGEKIKWVVSLYMRYASHAYMHLLRSSFYI